MTYNLYAFYDLKTKVYRTIITAIHDGAAVRVASFLASDGKDDYSRFSEDFILYKVGTWDDATSHFENIHPVEICRLDKVKGYAQPQ